MRITFVLPGPPSPMPVGGYRVIYEYGNRLARRGHRVTIWHLLPRAVDHDEISLAHRTWRILYRKLSLMTFNRSGWFKLDSGIHVVNSNEVRKVPDADALVAVGWQAAETVYHSPGSKGAKMHYVADYEQWLFASKVEKERFGEAFSLPLYKIAMSEASARMLRHYYDQPTIPTIPLGLDLDLYRIIRPIPERHEPMIGLAYRTPKYKGIEDGLAALRLAKAGVPSAH